MKKWYVALVAAAVAAVSAPALLRAEPQTMKIGAKPENFSLSAPDGKQYNLFEKERPKATVVLFIATQCPVSRAYDGRMAELGKEYGAKGVRFVAVNSNKQEPAPEVGEHAAKSGFNSPVVKDPNNLIADKWGALVTPEAFLLNGEGVLVYHGRIDDNQKLENVKNQDLRTVLDAVLAGKTPEKSETKAFGCTIKRI